MQVTPSEIQEAFKALGTEPSADMRQLRQVYRHAIRVAHPDLGGSTESAQAINHAWDVLTRAENAGTLAALVDALKAPRFRPGATKAPPEVVLKSVPRAVREAISDFGGSVVVEHDGRGRWAVWVYGTMFRTSLSAPAVVRVLEQNVRHGDAASLDVWVFDPGKHKEQTTLGMLEERLCAIVPNCAPKPAPVPAAVTPTDTLSDDLKTRWLDQSWGEERVGFLIRVVEGRAVVFLGKRIRRRLDVEVRGVYPGSVEALQALARAGITPDELPVWITHDTTDFTFLRAT